MIIFIINDIIASYIFLFILCANITWHTISKIITLYNIIMALVQSS